MPKPRPIPKEPRSFCAEPPRDRLRCAEPHRRDAQPAAPPPQRDVLAS